MEAVKLNIGCGLDAYSGWFNYDNSPTIPLSRLPIVATLLRTPAWPRSVIRRNVVKGLPWPDRSVDFIYSSHAFEHFTFADSLQVARECFRVLRPGGALRIVVPDLRKIIDEYAQNPDPMASHRFLHRMGIEYSVRELLHPGHEHHQLFDERSLSHLLRQAGFADPQERAYADSLIPDILSIELERRKFESLYVEAVR